MANSSTSDPDDLSPGDANDVILDITDTQAQTDTQTQHAPTESESTESESTGQSRDEPERPFAVDPNDGVADNGEEVPTGPGEVDDSSDTAERLHRHARVPPPEGDPPTRMQ